MQIKQYCRYCAFCFQADEDEFRCSAEINGQQLHMTRKQINRATTCKEFKYCELGDVVTGKQYQPKQERQEDNSQPELF